MKSIIVAESGGRISWQDCLLSIFFTFRIPKGSVNELPWPCVFTINALLLLLAVEDHCGSGSIIVH